MFVCNLVHTAHATQHTRKLIILLFRISRESLQRSAWGSYCFLSNCHELPAEVSNAALSLLSDIKARDITDAPKRMHI